MSDPARQCEVVGTLLAYLVQEVQALSIHILYFLHCWVMVIVRIYGTMNNIDDQLL